MTESLAAAEPNVRTFETTVAGIDGREVTLEETYFYPAGGGQPADRGTIDDVPLSDVSERDGEVIHELAADHDLTPGESVLGRIDD